MKRLIKTALATILIVVICMSFASCNFVLEMFSGSCVGVDRGPNEIADSVWRTDDGRLTIYGTGNKESATAFYTHNGKTGVYYITFDNMGKAYVYSNTEIQNVRDPDTCFDLWEVDYINYDYHNYLEIQPTNNLLFFKEFNTLFADEKPVKLRRVKGETIPEKQLVEQGENYRIFKNGDMYGVKIINNKGKVVISELSVEQPKVSRKAENMVEIHTVQQGTKTLRFFDLLTGEVSRTYDDEVALYSVADGLIAYCYDDGEDQRSVAIDELFSYGCDIQPLDFLDKKDVITDIQLVPKDKTVIVSYQTSDKTEIQKKSVKYDFISPETYETEEELF